MPVKQIYYQKILISSNDWSRKWNIITHVTDVETEKYISTISLSSAYDCDLQGFNSFVVHVAPQLFHIAVLIIKLHITCTIVIFEDSLHPATRAG